MLYKVTPMLTPAEPKEAEAKRKAKETNPDAPKEPRKRRKSAVFDADGNEVLITMMCLKCRQMKPLGMFGLRKMADGAIRNQPWCRTCRSGAGTKKPKDEVAPEATAPATVEVAAVTAAPASPASDDTRPSEAAVAEAPAAE
ncbi:MAG: hypothetical protein SFW67_33220 [Myxococcaceae bacterium]|nr:hypothetical protein [Myxococcaceae bacterium]